MTAQSKMNSGAEDALQAHCLRVAAWAGEMARALELAPVERAAIQQHGLSHHWNIPLNDLGFQRLADDLKISIRGMCSEGRKPSTAARTILEAANLLDEQLELAPYDRLSTIYAIEELTKAYPVVGLLRKSNRDDLIRTLPKMPVYPAIAVNLLRSLTNPNLSLMSVERMVTADQVLTGKLIAIANSVVYSPEERIGSISRAITHMGTEDTRRVITAELVRPLFGSSGLRGLWLHAVAAAKAAEGIAQMTESSDGAEAFLAGLMHDVGRLAMALLDSETVNATKRLIDAGCQPLLAEAVLCGFDHAEAGAEILKFWNFPANIESAVRFHHEPEQATTPLASILYLTEFWTASDEDSPSNLRLRHAEEITNVSLHDLTTANVSRRSLVDEL